jgi:hypothetical protein
VPEVTVVALIDVTAAECDEQLLMKVALLGQDDVPVTRAGPTGPEPVQFGSEVRISCQPGSSEGFAGRGFAVTRVPPLALAPGEYHWKVMVNGHGQKEWCAPFFVPQRRSPVLEASDPTS